MGSAIAQRCQPAGRGPRVRQALGALGLALALGGAACQSGGAAEERPPRTPATPLVVFLGGSDSNVSSELAVPSPVVLQVRGSASPLPSPIRLDLNAGP